MLTCIFAGAISVVSLFDWWFRSLHVTNRIFFYIISFFLWSGIFRIVLNWYQLARVKPIQDNHASSKIFSVAIFTTAAPGEPLTMFETTFRALSKLEYPCTIYFLDGTNDTAYKELSSKFGFQHFEFSEVHGAKAGKINEALKRTTEEIVLILDPDHIVFPTFLNEVVGFFENEEIGFVQVSQGYYNQYRSPVAKAAAEQTYLFYGPTQRYYGSDDKAIAIGANCIFRRSALEQIGGHAQGLAEDLLTSLRIHAAGWKSIYYPIIVNRGLVPEDFDSFAKQQLKWARGLFEVLFDEYPKVFKQLSLSAKFRYWTIGTFYLVGVRTLFFLIVPILYFFFGWSALNMSFSEFMIRAMPFAIFALLIYILSQRYLIDYQSEKGIYWRGMLMKFASWPVFTYAFYLTIVNKKIPYLPTSKRGNSKISIFFWPLLVYILLLVLSVSFHFYRLHESIDLKKNFDIQQQTLGMLSFSIIACLQHISAIILILKSSKVQHTDAWDEVNKYLI